MYAAGNCTPRVVVDFYDKPSVHIRNNENQTPICYRSHGSRVGGVFVIGKAKIESENRQVSTFDLKVIWVQYMEIYSCLRGG